MRSPQSSRPGISPLVNGSSSFCSASKRHPVVDDETLALKYFSKAFGQRFPIYAASSAAEALEVLDVNAAEIGAVVTESADAEAPGVELLTIVRNKYRAKARILRRALLRF